ncbi:MAG: tRNA (uracil-5-)-methyltransferase [Candidatus Latescibacterota bacterium]|nr:MAG: tRNA (uracil-5-)-methyltransferase [Candidatus Latescibacterota bacterium]
MGSPFGDPRDAVAVVDPPRTGLAEGAARALGDLAPRFALYVSCDPATLARDCRTLAASGYETLRVRPVDMFPQTPHVETLALLARR